MAVVLNPNQEALVMRHVSDQGYPDPNAVLDEALRLLILQEERRQAEWDQLRAVVADGVEDIKQGRVVSSEEVFERIREMSRQRRAASP